MYIVQYEPVCLSILNEINLIYFFDQGKKHHNSFSPLQGLMFSEGQASEFELIVCYST